MADEAQTSAPRPPDVPDITHQVTSQTPATKPATEKNPKRVAVGKCVAEKTRQARETKKIVAEEAAVIIAKNKAKGSPPVAPCPPNGPQPFGTGGVPAQPKKFSPHGLK